jgi:hypothetical protein
MNILVVICSKFPNDILINSIDSLKENQINNDHDQKNKYKIIVVDSGSNNFVVYEKINILFPDVNICYIQNKNYEYGAYKYAIQNFQDFDIYICLQDSCIISKYIDLSVVNEMTAYIYYDQSGYQSHLSIKEKGKNFLKHDQIIFDKIINERFTLATHCFLIVTKNVMIDIFKTLTIPPQDKDGSCIYERNFGIYFILKEMKTINVSDKIRKIHNMRM